MRVDTVTPNAGEPLTLDEAKLHLRVISTADDALIIGLISSARDYVERLIGYPMMTAGMRATLDEFPRSIPSIRYPWRPSPIVLLGVNVAVTGITYTDTDGATQTLDPAAYQVDASGGGARITPAFGTQWPATRPQPASVAVAYTAGFSTVPESLKAAMKLLIGDLYENREAQTVGLRAAAVQNPAADNLIFPHRLVIP